MPLTKPRESQKHDQYFEATIQLRPYNKEIYDYVINQFRKSESAWPAKQTKIKTGIDINSSSWRAAVAIGKKLKKVFGGELIVSRKLYSTDHMTSKKVYRVTVCHRISE